MIKDLELKKEVIIPMMIEDLDEKIDSKNNPYISFTGKDKTGSLDCRLWGYDLNKLGDIKNGDIVMAKGYVEEFNNKKQFKILKSDKGRYMLRPSKDEDNLNLEDFIRVSPSPYGLMISEINEMIFKYSNIELQRLCLRFLDKYKNELEYYPGAKNVHHAYKTGWLYHIYNMMKMGNSLADIYNLNKDLLLTGVLLHDIGKIPAMVSDLNGCVNDFTLEGAMLEHIVLGIKMLADLTKDIEIKKETITLIEHMISSHHGNLEWGSPVMPMFPEAEALHYLDNMDAKLNIMSEILDTVEEGKTTEKIFSLGNRRIYKHNL